MTLHRVIPIISPTSHDHHMIITSSPSCASHHSARIWQDRVGQCRVVQGRAGQGIFKLNIMIWTHKSHNFIIGTILNSYFDFGPSPPALHDPAHPALPYTALHHPALPCHALSCPSVWGTCWSWRDYHMMIMSCWWHDWDDVMQHHLSPYKIIWAWYDMTWWPSYEHVMAMTWSSHDTHMMVLRGVLYL